MQANATLHAQAQLEFRSQSGTETSMVPVLHKTGPASPWVGKLLPALPSAVPSADQPATPGGVSVPLHDAMTWCLLERGIIATLGL